MLEIKNIMLIKIEQKIKLEVVLKLKMVYLPQQTPKKYIGYIKRVKTLIRNKCFFSLILRTYRNRKEFWNSVYS